METVEKQPEEQQEIFFRPEQLDLYVNMLEYFLKWAATVPELAVVEEKEEG